MNHDTPSRLACQVLATKVLCVAAMVAGLYEESPAVRTKSAFTLAVFFLASFQTFFFTIIDDVPHVYCSSNPATWPCVHHEEQRSRASDHWSEPLGSLGMHQ